MKKHMLRLLGGSTRTARVPVEALLEAVGALVDGAWLATRLCEYRPAHHCRLDLAHQFDGMYCPPCREARVLYSANET